MTRWNECAAVCVASTVMIWTTPKLRKSLKRVHMDTYAVNCVSSHNLELIKEKTGFRLRFENLPAQKRHYVISSQNTQDFGCLEHLGSSAGAHFL